MDGFYQRSTMFSKINMTQFIKNSMLFLITGLFLITSFFMSLFFLAIAITLTSVVVFRLWWRRLIQRLKSVNRNSTKTIVDAEYTVVEK